MQTGREPLDWLGRLLLLLGPALLVRHRHRHPVPVLYGVCAVALAYLAGGYPYGPVFLAVAGARRCTGHFRPPPGPGAPGPGYRPYRPAMYSNTRIARVSSLSRRGLLRAAVAGSATAGPSWPSAPPSPPPRHRRTPAARRDRPAAAPTTPGHALRRLADGNRRWRTYRQQHPDESRTGPASARPSTPWRSCSAASTPGSPPELVFDQGLGDPLTVRSAGEVLDEAVLGSVAYGVLELGVPCCWSSATS